MPAVVTESQEWQGQPGLCLLCSFSTERVELRG
jgi:hypothetical protein